MNAILRRKLIITGTGRAGTTFLVQLLTELGLETGFSPGTKPASYHEHCHAGLEHDLRDPQAPYVVKNPNLCDTLGPILEEGGIVIDHAIVPMRRLEDAARSRIRVGGDGRTPGGLTGTRDESQQQRVLAERFHRLIHTLATHQVPATFLEFPRFAQDAAYTFAALRAVLPASVSWTDFAAAFARTSRPELIHRFNGQHDASAGVPARAHAAERRAVRAARRRQRWAAVGALALMLGVVGWIQSGPTEEPNSGRVGSGETEPAFVSFERPASNERGLYLDPAPRLRTPSPPLRIFRAPHPSPRLAGRLIRTPTWM